MTRYPLHVLWQLTRLCNLRCRHCSAEGGARDPYELEVHEIEGILDQLRDAGVIDIAFSGGEPLLRSDIFAIVEAAVERGFRVGLGTNGWRFRGDDLERLVKLGLHRLQVSIDGMAEAHDAIRRHKSSARVWAAIEAAAAVGLRVHVCYTPQRTNLADFEPLAEQAVRAGVALFNVSQFVPVGRGSAADELSAAEWKAFFLRWKTLREHYQERMAFTSHLAQRVLIEPELLDRREFVGCAAGRGQACITPKGLVTPCVLIPDAVGDLRQRPFQQIWANSPLIAKLQDRDNLKGMCRVCSVREKCGGCRAAALACHGDLFADDPRCWSQPVAYPSSSAGLR